MLIRDADSSDALDVYNWRNDLFSRQMSLNTGEISPAEHLHWFDECLRNPKRTMYVGLTDAGKVGICRFDFSEATLRSEVSINLNPLMRGRGLSFELLSQAIQTYKQKHLATLTATIKRENTVSVRLFEKCGFTKSHEEGTLVYLERELRI